MRSKIECLIASLLVFFGIVTLIWDPNDPTPEGYRLFARVNGYQYNYSEPIWTGTSTTVKVRVPDKVLVYFVVRAYKGSDESGDSNEVKYIDRRPTKPEGIKLEE